MFRFLKSKSSFSIITFLLVYAVLITWFSCYVGITTPGGKWYSPFLDNYLNIPNWLTFVLARASLNVLKLLGFTVYQHTPNNVTITGSRGVTIFWACLGFGVMSFWTAFTAAHKAAWQFKLKWWAMGISFILVLNVIRISLIAVANHYHWLAVTSLDAHETFNIASYLVLFGLIGWFVWRYRQYEKKKVLTLQASPARLSALIN